MSIVDQVRKRSREEWVQHWKEKFTNGRIWIQEHPEQAALAGLLVGMVIVLFFRLFLSIALLFGLLLFGIWAVALPENSSTPSSEPKSGEPL